MYVGQVGPVAGHHAIPAQKAAAGLGWAGVIAELEKHRAEQQEGWDNQKGTAGKRDKVPGIKLIM